MKPEGSSHIITSVRKKVPKNSLVLKNQIKLEQLDMKLSGLKENETSRKDSTVSTFLPAIGNPFISQVNQNRNNITTSKSVLDFHAPPVIQSRRRSESLLKSTDNLAFKRYYRLDNDSYLSQTHWNDWFGKPGGGAPSFSAHKKNLDHMLEPPRSKNHEYEAFRKNYENLQFRRYDSNHHNFYEIKNPQESSRVHNFY